MPQRALTRLIETYYIKRAKTFGQYNQKTIFDKSNKYVAPSRNPTKKASFNFLKALNRKSGKNFYTMKTFLEKRINRKSLHGVKHTKM